MRSQTPGSVPSDEILDHKGIQLHLSQYTLSSTPKTFWGGGGGGGSDLPPPAVSWAGGPSVMRQTTCLRNMIGVKAVERWSNTRCTNSETRMLFLQTLDKDAGSMEEQQQTHSHLNSQCQYIPPKALPPACTLPPVCTKHYHLHVLYHQCVQSTTTCMYSTTSVYKALPPACTLPPVCTKHYHLHVLYHQCVQSTTTCMYSTTSVYNALPPA